MSFDARRIDATYSLITLPEVETVTDLVDSWQQTIPTVRERIGALRAKRKQGSKVIKSMLTCVNYAAKPRKLSSESTDLLQRNHEFGID